MIHAICQSDVATICTGLAAQWEQYYCVQVSKEKELVLSMTHQPSGGMRVNLYGNFIQFNQTLKRELYMIS
jgi:hypothetical protein